MTQRYRSTEREIERERLGGGGIERWGRERDTVK